MRNDCGKPGITVVKPVVTAVVNLETSIRCPKGHYFPTSEQYRKSPGAPARTGAWEKRSFSLEGVTGGLLPLLCILLHLSWINYAAAALILPRSGLMKATVQLRFCAKYIKCVRSIEVQKASLDLTHYFYPWAVRLFIDLLIDDISGNRYDDYCYYS